MKERATWIISIKMYLEYVGWYVIIFGTLSALWHGKIPVRCSVFYSCDCPIPLNLLISINCLPLHFSIFLN